MKEQISFVSGHTPSPEEVQFELGPYQVIRSIGKGGMGEVFLAYDTTCGRKIALKKIRDDLLEHAKIHFRFLKEARITSQLTHPAIIPIYAIHEEENHLYYTMPYVEGETLKQILRKTLKDEKKGDATDHTGSIPSLIRIFLNVCQAVAYAHSNQVIHRDIKPENIIVGPYGEVLILDWGLAKMVSYDEREDSFIEQSSVHSEITHFGKVVGTVSYMAPERALGEPANFQTDIYSLGVILYQILTLYLPFRRESLKSFREKMTKEIIPNPMEVAPHRDVPLVLCHLVNKCLAFEPEERYQSVHELTKDIEYYIEGRSEWFQSVDLDISNKEDWEFQEHVFMAEHVAITRGAEEADWVNLMISKASFSENTKIEAKACIGEKGHGIGFLLSVPEAAERTHLNDGYCLWLSSDINKSTKLLRSTVEVIHASSIYLQRNMSYDVRIEKVEQNLYFYLNDTLQFSYVSHLPLAGTHIGFISRDTDFEISPLNVSLGSQNIMVNCLAVPDAFLAHKDFQTALTEYRRIAYSFSGRAEGREALFRAGITLLEEARHCDEEEKREKLFDLALEEFEKLHNSPGAPLEYLGKSLVYRAMKEYEEEVKCFELAYRRYHRHPLLHVLQEQIIYRMYECSRFHRKATYLFILLAVQHLPKISTSIHTKRLFRSVQKHWEPLPFVEDDPSLATSKKLQHIQFGIQLAFWLAKPYALIELMNSALKKEKRSLPLIANALFSAIELGAWQLTEEKTHRLHTKIKNSELKNKLAPFQLIFDYHHRDELPSSPQINITFDEERVYLYLLEKLLHKEQKERLNSFAEKLTKCNLSEKGKVRLDCVLIWAALWDKNWKEAGERLHHYSMEELTQETSLLYFLYGCWLLVAENQEIASIHFSGVLPVSYPRSWTLFSHYQFGTHADQKTLLDKTFLWEKLVLWRQLKLYHHCLGDTQEVQKYQELEKECLIDQDMV